MNITVTINGSGFQSEDTVADTGSYTQEGLEPGTVYTIDVSVAFGGMIGTNFSRIQANTLGMYFIRTRRMPRAHATNC